MNMVQGDARIGDILQAAVLQLEKAGIENGRVDAELLLGHCVRKSRTELYLASSEQIGSADRLVFNQMIARRCCREPVAYILGEREFWSQCFIVSPDVLIPRPETEFLVETALLKAKERGGVDLCLDLCCGSGIIGIIMAMETGCRVVATDISARALSVCSKNSARLGVSNNVIPVRTDIAAAVDPGLKFDLITANPPYISSGDVDQELDPDVADYEPRLALDGGPDGLDLIRRIAESLPGRLQSGGDFFMEIGHDQGDRVKELFVGDMDRCGYAVIEILEDYAGRDRVVHVRRK